MRVEWVELSAKRVLLLAEGQRTRLLQDEVTKVADYVIVDEEEVNRVELFGTCCSNEDLLEHLEVTVYPQPILSRIEMKSLE